MITETQPRLRIAGKESDGTFHLVQARDLGKRYDIGDTVSVEGREGYLSCRIQTVFDGGRLKPVIYKAELANRGVN